MTISWERGCNFVVFPRVYFSCSLAFVSVLLYSFMICLLGLKDSYAIKCGSPLRLKKKMQNTNESAALGKYLINMLLNFKYWLVLFFFLNQSVS